MFAEFVYPGGYTPPGGEIKATGSSIGFPSLVDSITDEPEQSSNEEKGSTLKAEHEEKRANFRNLTSTPPPNSTHEFRSPADKFPREYPNANFLVHARVYVLAELYGIKKLKFLALQKLHVDLSNSYPFGEAHYRDVAVLIKYAYENTLWRQPKDELRMLVSRYVADEGSRAFRLSRQFYGQLEGASEFARDQVAVILANCDYGES